MSTEFDNYRSQLSEWFQKENSNMEFLDFWNKTVSEGEEITRNMEISETTLVKVIGI